MHAEYYYPRGMVRSGRRPRQRRQKHLVRSAAIIGVLTGAILGNVPVANAQGQSIWDGIYTEPQAQRGATLYENGCAECHGESLEGGEMEPSLMGGEFMWGWSGQSVGDLFERIRLSMPPGEPSALSRQEKADVVAFLLAQNGVPAGDVELADRASALGGIAFEAEPAP